MTIWKSMFAEFDERIAETERSVTAQSILVTALTGSGGDAHEARQCLVELVDVLKALHRRRSLLVQLLRGVADPSQEVPPEASQP